MLDEERFQWGRNSSSSLFYIEQSRYRIDDITRDSMMNILLR